MIKGEQIIAILPETDQKILGSENNEILLSQETFDDHIYKHPEITEADYQNLQKIIDSAEVWRLPNKPERLIYLLRGRVTYQACVKRTQDGRKNYMTTLFRNSKQRLPNNAERIR
ncbi:MAG: hypothetical protein QM537_09820 [Candidatus Symbiobacter sp.]|nr:hypothetical protein [Candidatus Symbiobacter sp.]